MQIVVTDFYQLSRMDGKFNEDFKAGKLLRSKQKVTQKHVDRINGNSLDCGKLYVIDEEATKIWIKEHIKWRETRQEMDMLQVEGSRKLIEAVKTITQPKKAIPIPVMVENGLPDGDPNEDWSKAELKKYCDENKIEYHHKAGEVKLLELINV